MIPPLKPIPRRYQSGQRVRKSRRHTGKDAAFVYVVECPAAQTVKVGYSNSPAMRLRCLTAETGQTLFLRWHAETTRDDAKAIEAAFHKANKAMTAHATGEWYKRGAESVIAEIVRIADSLSIEMRQSGNVQTLKGAEAYEAERSRDGQVVAARLTLV